MQEGLFKMVHTYNPSIRFKVILCYIVSSRKAWETGDQVSTNKTPEPKALTVRLSERNAQVKREKH